MNQVTHDTHVPVLPALLAGPAVESARGPQWSALGRRHWGRVMDLPVGRIVIDVEWQQAFRAYAASAELLFTTPRWQGHAGRVLLPPAHRDARGGPRAGRLLGAAHPRHLGPHPRLTRGRPRAPAASPARPAPGSPAGCRTGPAAPAGSVLPAYLRIPSSPKARFLPCRTR